jgi:hypothetical protein
VHEQVIRRTLAELSEFDLASPPPVAAGSIHRVVRGILGKADPYAETKHSFTQRALELLPELRRRVDKSADPFDAAIRMAAAGNIIDLGVKGDLTHDDVDRAIERAASVPVDDAAIEELRRAAGAAESILYIVDNAGEIVFDRLFLEKLPRGRVKVAVKGGAVINDATRGDAEEAGIAEIAEIIDTGDDTPGAVLEEASADFNREVEEADLVIAKGQGNYEALSNPPRDIYFLLMVKCDVLAENAAAPLGTLFVGRHGPSGTGAEGGDAAARARSHPPAGSL